MDPHDIRVFPLGDGALTVELGNVISPEVNERAVALAAYLDSNRFPGYIESIPAYSSVSVIYDVVEVHRAFSGFQNAFTAVREAVMDAYRLAGSNGVAGQRVEIPVNFASEHGPDLGYVAERSGLTCNEVIDIFLGKEYRVYLLGFLPGFAYMGEVDARIATPRHETPRTTVPKGSVGIAGRQTGIYSLSSPGGWQIIGVTDMQLFRPENNVPSLLGPGDTVRFIRA